MVVERLVKESKTPGIARQKIKEFYMGEKNKEYWPPDYFTGPVGGLFEARKRTLLSKVKQAEQGWEKKKLNPQICSNQPKPLKKGREVQRESDRGQPSGYSTD